MTSSPGRRDRSVLIAAGVLAGSVALLGVALLSILVALRSDGADLPAEGNISDIVGQTATPDGVPITASADLGPLPPPPVRLAIPRLYVDAPITKLTLGGDRYPQVPDRPDQVAWYDFTASPGQKSNAVLSGHVDWQTRTGQPIPGVFYRIRELEIGDTLVITREDGVKLSYKVTGNVATPYDDPNVLKAMGNTPKESITLITCGGSWLKTGQGPYGGNYSHRVLVRAERVPEAVAAP